MVISPPRIDGYPGDRAGLAAQSLVGDRVELEGDEGSVPRPAPRLPVASVGHLVSFAQPTPPGAGPSRHPNDFVFLVLGAGGAFLLRGIFSVTTASVAIRRNRAVDCTGMARMP
jgi:hypothetical protein